MNGVTVALDIRPSWRYVVDKAGAAGAAPAGKYFRSFLHHLMMFTQNLGQTHLFLQFANLLSSILAREANNSIF